jgi:peptide/nickel transport system substrate-binding protein
VVMSSSLSASVGRARSLVFVAAAAVVLSGCATPAPGAPASTGASTPGATTNTPATAAVSATGNGLSVVFADFAEPANINPALSSESTYVSHLIFDSLVDPEPATGAATPGLAASWDQSPDGLTYTFHIRPGVKWSDNQPFTADDAKFTLDMIRDAKNASPYKSNFDQIASIEVPDAMTLTVNLKAPACSFLLNAMSMPILPKHALANSADLTKDPFNSEPTTGTGAFVFKERQKGDHITLVANPNYWRGKPKFDQWILKVVPDANVEALQLKTGEVDYSIVQPDAMQDLQQGGLDIKAFFAHGFDYLTYNEARPMFQDPKVRQALTYALDRSQIVDQVLFGQGQVVNTPIPTVSWAFDAGLPPFAYNLDTSRQLLTDAGWKAGPDGILQKDGKPFQFELATNSGNKVRAADTVIAQAQFKKLGIDVTLNTLELSAFNQKTRQQRDFDAVVFGATVDIDPDQTAIWSDKTANGQNYIGYSNPAVDQILKQAATVPGCGQADRTQLYKQFQETLAQDQPYTFLYTRKLLVAVNKRVQGVQPSAWAGNEVNIQDWVVTGH